LPVPRQVSCYRLTRRNLLISKNFHGGCNGVFWEYNAREAGRHSRVEISKAGNADPDTEPQDNRMGQLPQARGGIEGVCNGGLPNMESLVEMGATSPSAEREALDCKPVLPSRRKSTPGIRMRDTTEGGTTLHLRLKQASDVKIQGYVKIQGAANPFDASYEEYFEKRDATKMANRLSSRRLLLAIWRRQGGRCFVCGERIITETGRELHHIVRKIHGGSDSSENLCLLHPACHRQGHSFAFKFVLPVGSDHLTSCDSSRVR
jgi:hypothetical protein